jgi:transposase
LVREYVEAQAGRIVIEWLPAYAPEPNPVEFL